jgi:hypothetical protein
VQTEGLSVELRPRSAWEAVDVGLRMAQHWWRPIFGAWFALVAPLVLLLSVAFWGRLGWAWLVFWWLKPLLERIPLYVTSEALFGHVPSVREVLRALPRVLRTHWLWVLTLYRLAPARSFTMPVILLEGLGGAEQRERIRALHWQSGGVPTLLTIVCYHIELIVLWAGGLAFLSLFIPETSEAGFIDLLLGGDVEGAPVVSATQWLVYVVAVSIISPFYSAAGFSLYLHRRVYLEGWDIDLRFRGLARRVAVAALLLALIPASARAELRDPVDAPEALAEILEEPEFQVYREIEIWAPRSKSEEREEVEWDWAWLEDLRALLSGSLQVLIVLALALSIGLILRWIARLDPEPSEMLERPVRPDEIAGLDIRPESLPGDAIDVARSLFAQDRMREALALLYRAALSYLVHERDLELPTSATEGECARRVAALDELAEDFSALTRSWQSVAYARRAVSPETFEQLCLRWSGRLGPAT